MWQHTCSLESLEFKDALLIGRAKKGTKRTPEEHTIISRALNHEKAQAHASQPAAFVILPGITNRAGCEAQACAFSCFRARDHIACSSGVHSVPFFALAISRASLNSGLSREHVCCHMLPPAHVFPSSLGNTPVTEIGGSPFPHGGTILDVGELTRGSGV